MAGTLSGNTARAATVEQDGGLAVCAIDLREDAIGVYYTDTEGQRFGSIDRLRAWMSAQQRVLECATNGGIFDRQGAPLGWLVADGVLLHALNRNTDAPGNFFLQPNGALIVDAGGARILATREIASRTEEDLAAIRLAVQSGPLLVENGRINDRFDPDSRSLYSRNGACVRDSTHLLLVYSPRPVSLFVFASRLRDALGCRDALYLDGHLSVFFPGFEDNASRQPLSTFIAVTHKEQR